MLKHMVAGAGLALALGFAAQAQPDATPTTPDRSESAMSSDQAPAASSATQSGVDAAAVAKPGMIVKDNAGATIGTVMQAGKTAEGISAVVVKVDGKPFTVAATTLTPAGDGLVSSMSKAEIKGAPAGR